MTHPGIAGCISHHTLPDMNLCRPIWDPTPARHVANPPPPPPSLDIKANRKAPAIRRHCLPWEEHQAE